MSTTIFLMTVFILLAVLAGDALRTRLRQKEMQRHDRVLFLFCQLRRDVMRFLYMNVIENTDSLSLVEYESVRRLLNVLDAIIHDYNQHQTSISDVRQIVKHFKMYRKISKTALETSSHPEIREFNECIHRLLGAALLAYTPLTRSRSGWRLCSNCV